MIAAIRNAMLREKEAYRLYLGLMKEAGSPNLETFFREIALQEIKHESLLSEFLRTGDIEESKQKLNDRYYNEDLEVIKKLNPNIDINFKDIEDGFAIAISEEIKAQKKWWQKRYLGPG